MLEITISVLLLFGSAFLLISGIGILKMPDILARTHAVSKALTFGTMLVLLGLVLHFSTGFSTIKIFIALLFQFLTIPLAGHILANLAYKKTLK